MAKAIRVRALFHGRKAEHGHILGEWREFEDMGCPQAVKLVKGEYLGPDFTLVSRSNHWKSRGHQRYTFAGAGGLRVTIHVLSRDMHGCACDMLAFPPGHKCQQHPHSGACVCVDCLSAAIGKF